MNANDLLVNPAISPTPASTTPSQSDPSPILIPGLAASPGRPLRPARSRSEEIQPNPGRPGQNQTSGQEGTPSPPSQSPIPPVSEHSLSVTQPTSGGTGRLQSNVSELRRKYGYEE